jgi:hypothetical protein
MKNPFLVKNKITVFFITLIIGSLACSGSENNHSNQQAIDLAVTQLALELTQQALNAPSPSTLPTQPPTQEEPKVNPTPSPDITYEGISFSFDKSIASGVTPQTILGQSGSSEDPPWMVYPTHFQFDFIGYALNNTFHQPVIYVYPASEYASMQSYVGDIINQLNQILSSKPTQVDDMPFLPIFNAAQFIQSKIAYLDFQNGSGVRYVTMYGQAAWPINSQDLFYTFQGITTDRAYYVSAIFPASHSTLPATSDEATPEDWVTFSENFSNYLLQIEGTLDELEDTTFFPDLLKLDAVCRSIFINR